MMMMSDTQCNLPQKLIAPHNSQKNLIVPYRITGMYLHAYFPIQMYIFTRLVVYLQCRIFC